MPQWRVPCRRGDLRGKPQAPSDPHLATDDVTPPTITRTPAAESGDGHAAPPWEAALAEVAQRIPAYATTTFPMPMVATVPMFTRLLCRADPGGGPDSSDDDFLWMAPLAGGIEPSLRRLAASEGGNPTPFLRDEGHLLIDVKLHFGPAFKDAAGPLVRAATGWGKRPWPKTSRDQLALFRKYLAKDPDVVPALMAAIALGVPRLAGPNAEEGSFGRQLQEAERAFGDYFARRGSPTYCDLIRETVRASEGPGYGVVTAQLLKVASYAIRVGVEASSLVVTEMMVALRAEAREKEGKAADIRAVRRERDKDVAAARKEGMATSGERVRVLEARVRELEGQLDAVRRREAREKAHLEQQREKPTAAKRPAGGLQPASGRKHDEPAAAPAPPAATAPPAEARPSLEGRPVFVYTNRSRGGAREAFHAELEALGASEPKVYETKGASVPGPRTFPPGSVVIVDTSFMSHSFSEVISRRARAAENVVLLEDRIGIGGLARRLADALNRRAPKGEARTE